MDDAEDVSYWNTWRANLLAAMKYRGKTARTLKAAYKTGPKLGLEVGIRTQRHQVEGPADGKPSPTLDTMIALAAAVDFSLPALLTPGFDPARPPVMGTSEDIDEEVDRRVEFKWRLYQDQLQKLRVAPDESQRRSPPAHAHGSRQDEDRLHRRLPHVSRQAQTPHPPKKRKSTSGR